MAENNGRTAIILYLVGVLVTVNIALSAWALTNVVAVKEDIATLKQQTKTTEASVQELSSEVRDYHRRP